MPPGDADAVVVRRADPGDARAIEDVRYAGWWHTYRHLIPRAYFDAWDREAFTRRRVREGFRPGHGVFVAEERGRVVGYVVAGPYRGADTDGTGEIWAIYLDPAYIGRGVGRRLLDTGLAHLTGFPRVVVWHLRENHGGARFYASAGFVEDGETRDQHVGGVVLPEVRRTLFGP